MDNRTPAKRGGLGIGRVVFCAVIILLVAAGAQAQATESGQDTLGTEDHSRRWAVSLLGMYYLLPEEADIPVITAQGVRDQLHLEARYNYEGLRTASAFLGWNVSGGESVQFEVTPMAGFAFGSTTGLIPALKLSLEYGVADLYAETEYLYDLNDSEGSFFYSWLELGFTPSEMIRAGAVAQRTRIVQTPLEIDRGIFAQVAHDQVALSVYALNLFTDSWFLVFSVGVDL